MSHHCPHKRSQFGFTLIELMIVLSVAGILAALALPSFSRQIAEIRRTNAVNAFSSSLSVTRSTSLKSPRNAVMCISTDQATCATAAVAQGNWALGWIVYSDVDSNGAFTAGTDTVIQTQPALGGILTAQSSPVISSLSFMSNGMLNSTNGGTISMVSTNTSISARNVVINRLGRVSAPPLGSY